MDDQEYVRRLERQCRLYEYALANLRVYAFDENGLSQDDFYKYCKDKIAKYGLPGTWWLNA